MMAKSVARTRHPGIYKRGSRYVVAYRDQSGKQRWESAKNLEDARNLKASRDSDVAKGEFQPASRVTFQEYAREWIERYQGRGRGFRESTRTDYRRHLELHAFPYFRKRKRLAEIAPRDIANFVGWLADPTKRKKPLSNATIKNIVATVRSCMATAVREGLIRHNPVQGVALPSNVSVEDAEGEDNRVLTRKQLKKLLHVVDSRHRLMFKLLAVTGLRWSELIGLQWRHLKLEGQRPAVRVRRGIVRGEPSPPKSRYSKREVPLEPKLARELRKLRMARGWPEEDVLVFQSAAGGPLDYSNTRRRILQPAARTAGAPWAGFHTFRHTLASILFARGANAVQVQRWLGHHSPAFTLATYVHLLDNDLGEPLDLGVELRHANKVQTRRARKHRKGPKSGGSESA